MRNALLEADPRIAFWKNTRIWPYDTEAHLFLGRALLILGQERFGSAWSDDIPATHLAWELPELLNLTTPPDEIRRGIWQLRECSETYRARSPGGLAGLVVGDVFPTPEEWELAVAEAKRKADASWDKFRPFLSVALEAAEAFRAGIVRTATRNYAGGQVIANEPHFWNLEKGWARCETCRINPADIFSERPFFEAGQWIFVEKSSFNTFLTNKDNKPSSAVFAETNERRNARKGRPEKYKWDQLIARFVSIVHEEGIPDDSTVSGIARRLAQWSMQSHGDSPDIDYLRQKIRIWISLVPRGA